MVTRPHSREKKIVDKTVKVEKRPINSSRENKTIRVFKNIFNSLIKK